jgi:hypothetical protein
VLPTSVPRRRTAPRRDPSLPPSTTTPLPPLQAVDPAPPLLHTPNHRQELTCRRCPSNLVTGRRLAKVLELTGADLAGAPVCVKNPPRTDLNPAINSPAPILAAPPSHRNPPLPRCKPTPSHRRRPTPPDRRRR